MERVTGIGGLFVGARDPDALAAWYAEHLGVDPPPPSYDVPSWWQAAGPTVFAPLPSGSAHLGGPDRSWPVNFRVTDLDAMVAQLRAAGIVADVDPERYPNGRFAALPCAAGAPILPSCASSGGMAGRSRAGRPRPRCARWPAPTAATGSAPAVPWTGARSRTPGSC